tara:strand:- start:359 stop:2125 length:1767 start_codon:yes stop_codon:yes gene_type:complete
MSHLNATIEFIVSKNRTVFIFLLFVNLPLIIFTWNTGNWSDDYQLLNLYFTKQSISPFSRIVLDIIETRVDGHFIPAYYFINTLIYKIYPSLQFFHFIIVLCHIGTAFMVFMIVVHTHNNRKVALLSGVLFSLSYCVCIKALAWNCFHSHVTNTFTGVIALYFALQYFKHERRIYLLYIFLFVIFSIHNMESGFAWPVVIGVFVLFELLRKRISIQVGSGLILIMMLAVSVYGLGTFCFTGKAFPVFFNRAQNTDALKEKLVDLREQDPDYEGHVADDSNGKKSLLTNEMRSTYAPRTLSVLVVRTGDLMMRLVNLSIVESRFRTYFKSYMQDSLTTVQERWLFKQKIKRIAKYVFVVIGLSVLIAAPFLIYFIIRNIIPETYSYLGAFVALFIVFVFVFNRIDIANSIAIFSSVFLSDFILRLVSKGKRFKKIGLTLLVFLLFMALVNILNGFNDVYQASFQPKKYLRLHHRVFQDINRTIGHYTESAIVFHPFVRNHYWIDGGDLGSLNIRMFQEDFMKTKLAKTYSSRSWDDFCDVTKIQSIKIVTVNTEAEAIKHVVNNVKMGEKANYLYVDKDLNVKRLQFKY